MRRLIVSLVIFLPLAGAVQLEPMEVTFQGPLVANADIASGPWQWLVLFVEPSEHAVATGVAESGGEGTTFIHESLFVEPGNGRNTRIPVRDDSERSPPPEGQFGAEAGGEWASVVVEGSDLAVQALNAFAAIDVRGKDWPLTFGAREPRYTSVRWDNFNGREPGTWLRVQSSDPAEPVQVRLNASSVRSIEWHGWNLRCAQDCGDATSDTTGAPVGQMGGSLDVHRYVRWTGDLSLKLEASAWVVVAGSAKPVSFGHNGVLRLPSAASEAFNHTGDALRLDGAGILSRLQVEDSASRQLTGTLQGSYAGIQLGESPVVLYSQTARAAAVAAAVLLPALFRWLWLLRARQGRLSEAQQDIADALQVAPGASYRDLMRLTGFSNGALDWHLRNLERRRLVVSREYKNTKRFFWGNVPQDWKRIVVTSRDELSALLEWAKSQDGFILTLAAEALDVRRSTLHGWLADLVDAGMLCTNQDGRRRVYRFVPPFAETMSNVTVTFE